MDKIHYSTDKNINVDELIRLYEDAGWTSYLNDIPRLVKAIESSLLTITAWEQNQLVGLVRVVGDGLTIVYIQDILIKKTHKRMGIGTSLLDRILKIYTDVRQKVLLTDDREETRGFYESNRFISCDDGKIVAFVRFD